MLIAHAEQGTEQEALFQLFLEIEEGNRENALQALQRSSEYRLHLEGILGGILTQLERLNDRKEIIQGVIDRLDEAEQTFLEKHESVLFPKYKQLYLPNGAGYKLLTSKAVVVDSGYPTTQIPEEYLTYPEPKPPEPRVNKSKSGQLYQDLKEGRSVPFAELVTRRKVHRL